MRHNLLSLPLRWLWHENPAPLLSPLVGEMPDRAEGEGTFRVNGVAAPSGLRMRGDKTPSVGCADISPTRGERGSVTRRTHSPATRKACP